MSNKLRVGVIGAGIGALHLNAYSQMPNVEIIALAGLDDDRVRRVAAEYKVPRTYREYEDLLAATDIDAVSICLPNMLHAPVTLAALQAGKHVLVEKPLARNAEEGRAMVAAAQESDKVLMVSFDKRYRGDAQWVKQYIDSGALGRIYYAKAHWMRRSGIPRLGSWFVSKDQAGGGPLIDLGVHMLDMAMYMMGEPRPLSVSASAYAEFGPRGLKGWPGRAQFSDEHLSYDVEDLASAFVRLEGGATLLLEASWASHGPAGDDFGVTLYGTEGGVELLVRNYTHENTVRVFTDIGGVPTDLAPRIPKADGHGMVIARFVAAVLDKAPPIPSPEDGLRRTLVLDACYRSAREGREIVL
ncbi:MAG TPA: Gfo/Idh/MocA family oxidoreductase [Roseiflexaceae bacterium]|nr:Gfo/Idh/MocA family oxidoreductase [Roseiflexaceae bacterium]